MNLLSSIVKSVYVVDNRRQDADSAVTDRIKADAVSCPVIKNRIIHAAPERTMPGADNRTIYKKELDKIIIEIDDKKNESAKLRAEIEALRREVRKEEDTLSQLLAENERLTSEHKELLSDETFYARQEEIHSMLEVVEKQSEEIVNAARKRVQEIEEEARSKAYEEGLTRGISEGEQSFKEANKPLADELARMITNLSQYGEELKKEKAGEMVTLCLTICERIVKREIKEDPAVISGMVRELIEENRGGEYVNITVSPDILPTDAKVTEEVRQYIESLSGNVKVYILKSAPPYSITCETEKGITDLSADTQLENIGRALEEAL